MMQTLPNDDALVENARHDPDAFAALYRRYLTPVYRYLLIRLGNPQEAEDITSRVFTEALEGLINQRYRENGKFAAWLFTIARRRLIDLYRQRPAVSLEEAALFDPDPFDQIQFSDNKTRLKELLSRLDEDKQELMRLRFAGGLSFAEIAALDGKSEAAVKMMVHRTIHWLRENWEAKNV
ncbi:MAG: sigma-70 family RNA polymerase sigma factor [Anaerolineaceae bacterium]